MPDRADLEADQRIRLRRDQYVWAIPGQRRLAQCIVPLYFTFDRDGFELVQSDGERYVVAVGSQASECQPWEKYLYAIDGLRGELLFVVPTGLRVAGIVVGDSHTALWGYDLPRSGKQHSTRKYKVLIVHLPDGKTVLSSDAANLGLDSIYRGAAAGGIVRLQGDKPDEKARTGGCRDWTLHDVYLEAVSGKRLSEDEATARVKSLVAQGVLDAEDPWRTKEAEPIESRGTIRCGNLWVRREERGWLVAVREDHTKDKTVDLLLLR